MRYWYAIAEREPIYATDGPDARCRWRPGQLLHPSAERFLAAAAALGFAEEPYKNAGGPPGAGLVPSNSRDGLRIDPARAYLSTPLLPGDQRIDAPPPSGAEAVQQRVWYLDSELIVEPRAPVVRSNSTVMRVLVQHGQTFGVELAGGERIPADEVVLCAGAVGTPRILMRSGIGPAETLRAAGIDVHVDLPDVGRGWSDHPAVFLPFRTDGPAATPARPHRPGRAELGRGRGPCG